MKVVEIFPIDEVLFFESDTRHMRVVSATDEGLARMALKDLAAGLDRDEFWQIRRGTLVGKRAIARVRRDELGNFTVELRGFPRARSPTRAFPRRRYRCTKGASTAG
jgi:DNA-binding LytR/AlgR family response regulator